METLKHLSPEQARNNYSVEICELPFMLVDNRAIRFTNIIFTDKGSGNEIYLVVTPKYKYLFLEIGYEPDCDGAYNWSHIQEESILIDCYDVNDSMYWNSKELFKILQSL